ncbi:hypothetical protein KKB58_01860 [Patescibacteria group bacterium]|nr:hypothetical protein [Patescibacteria group bacterium]
MAGGLFGGTVLAGEAMKEAEATRATKAAFAKQIRTIEGLDARIKDLTTALEKNKDLLEGYIKLDENGKPKEDNLVTGDRISGFSVKQDEVEKALANMEFLAKRNDLKLKQLIEKGQEDSEEAKSLQKSIVNNVIETARLNKLKNAIKEMNSIQDKLYNVKKDKSKETTSKTKSTPTTGSYTPPTPPPSTK